MGPERNSPEDIQSFVFSVPVPCAKGKADTVEIQKSKNECGRGREDYRDAVPAPRIMWCSH